MRDLPTISSLWIGPSFSFLEHLCLKSFVDAGHPTKLYVYEPVEHVPDDVEIADDIASTTVTLRKLDAILKSEKVKRTDLLVIDVEGHEMPVLQSVDLTKLRPRAILIESNGNDASQDLEIRKHLTDLDYTLHRLGDDIFGHNADYPSIDPGDMMALVGLDRIVWESPESSQNAA